MADGIEQYNLPLKHLAELLWGGDCESYKTNRRGTGYYGCAAHGGYVVDGRVLTQAEKDKIERYQPLKIPFHVLVQRQSQGEAIIGTSAVEFSDEARGRHVRYSPSLGPVEWKKLDVYVFEEDCDWSLLEHETNIRAEGNTATPEQKQKQIEDTFNTWIKPRLKVK